MLCDLRAFAHVSDVDAQRIASLYTSVFAEWVSTTLAVRPCLSNGRQDCHSGLPPWEQMLHRQGPRQHISENGASHTTFHRVFFSRNNIEQDEHDIRCGLGIFDAMTFCSRSDGRAPPPFRVSSPNPSNGQTPIALAMAKTNAWRQ